jgi:zinc protease
MEDLDAASVADVHEFYRAHYGPDNTVLTLCGDVTAEEGFALVERYFGDLPASAAPRRPDHPQLAPIERPVRVERYEVVPNDRLHVAFRLPVDETDDFIAAAVALDCIGGLATSRLVRRLVRREQTALGAHATAWGFVDGASLGFVVLDVAPGTDPDVVEAAFVEELEAFLQQGPTEVELEASLAQSERSWLSALASQEERADLVSHHLLLHDHPDVVNTHLDRLRDVTAGQVLDSARRWLRPDSRATVAYLVADDASDAEPATTEDVA